VEDFFATITDLWPAGRNDYHWHVLPGSELLRDRISRHYAEIANRPGLAQVSPASMHITVQQVAPVSEVTPTELAQIVSLVRDRCADIAPFRGHCGSGRGLGARDHLPDPPRLPSQHSLAGHDHRRQAGHRHQIRNPSGGLPPAPDDCLRDQPRRPGPDPGLAL
jgi:hypothetical protein